MSTLGVVTGFAAEARCLGQGGVRVACAGASAERARAGAARLLGEGVSGLVSFGVAGGLQPGLTSGMLILADAVLAPSGRRLPATVDWHERLTALAAAGDCKPLCGPVVGSDHLVATTAAKQALFEATGAVAVDMESHAVAEVAAAAGVPFLVVRAIADPFDQAISPVAWSGLGPDGRIRPMAAMTGLLRRPGELPAVLRLGRQTARALAALRRLAALAPPDLGLA